ncbi:MAG TPA: ABC transporter ATP-binding protein [Anaerolineae bacterium]|nr:ABC transporter ATP-binding protein [Anaerolineae bacterium]
MGNYAIKVEGLGKRYRIGERQKYKALRDVLTDAVYAPVRAAGRLLRAGGREPRPDSTIWALKDVSFEVAHGEVLGVIGRNGAGKSTLLKILSRITEPTEGEVRLRGRIGSLLEVGTGFHPELTGRDNVYLNGAILGMKRAEIERKFDEIVAFAEVEKFLDTPVKHYSSGMHVRLAFAVAAHLEPEILLVDEVLAVGDAAFQKKCLGKMGEVAEGGRTVLFVSHNMGSIQALCQRGILFENGIGALNGDIEQVISYYLGHMEAKSIQPLAERVDRAGKGKVRLVGLEISGNGMNSAMLSTGAPAYFVFDVDQVRPGMSCYFTIYNLQGQQLANFHSGAHGAEDVRDARLGTRLICDIDELVLVPGRYRINVALFSDGEMQDHVEAAAVFDVEQGVIRGRPVNRPIGAGNVCVPHRWRLPF